MVWFLSLLLLYGIFHLLISYIFLQKAVGSYDLRSYASSLEEQVTNNSFDYQRYQSLNTETITVTSSLNEQLEGTLIENGKRTSNTIICCHGITSSRWQMLKYADIFLDCGYNVLLFDARGHGQSQGSFPSYGYFEKQDLNLLLQFLKKRYPNGIFGAFGVSLGAATVLQHGGHLNSQNKLSDGQFTFYIADCPYSDLEAEFHYRMQADYGLPNLGFTKTAGWLCQLKYGFSFNQVSPTKVVEQIKEPVLFIHGQKDLYVPLWMGQELFDKKPEPKEQQLFQEAEHANSYYTDTKRYVSILKGFVTKFNHN